MSILIKNILLNSKHADVLIEGNKFREINENINTEAEYKIDGKNKIIIPSFANSHTHASMILLRGYADDMKVLDWLQKKIWPLEARLTEEAVYWGAKLACLEMIKTGTTFFFDMYHHPYGSARAVHDSGIRALITEVYFDRFEKDWDSRKNMIIENVNKIRALNCSRVIPGLGPHAIYTMKEAGLRWTKEFADKNSLFIHLHLSESEQEVADCIKETGKSPVEYLNDIGFLSPNLVACHSIWLSEKDIQLLAKNNVKIIHNPASNMKLSSGVFQYKKLKDAGLTIGLGTDGCASNNNLDMLEEMKFASLLQKSHFKDPMILPAEEALSLATNGFKIFGIDAGEIREGKLADCLLLDKRNIHLFPSHNLKANLVYSANSSCIDTTICDGKILMQNQKTILDEEDIHEKVNSILKELIKE